MQVKLQAALLSVGLATLGYWATPGLADEWNKRTTLTFHQPVEVPGHVLTPGTYVFQLADLPSDRDVVQVFSQDNQGMDHLVTMAMAAPDYRIATPTKPTVTFEERHITSPEAVHSWFYPGDNYGWQFIYPKSQQLTAVNTANTSVQPAPPAPPVAKTAVAKPAVTQPSQTAAAPAPKPAEPPVTIAQNRPPAQHAAPAASHPTPAPAKQPAAAPQTLPKTASNLPLESAAGSLLIGLGLAVFAIRRRVRA